ncbi:MAG: hypothetical protein ACETWG_12235 [Candidatus Neomarinimicrobiota bacterium]
MILKISCLFHPIFIFFIVSIYSSNNQAAITGQQVEESLPQIELIGKIEQDELARIKQNHVLSDSSVCCYSVYKLEELPNYFIVNYGQIIRKDFTNWNFLVLDQEYNIVLKSNWYHDDWPSMPQSLDINQDSVNDLIVNFGTEDGSSIFIYLQEEDGFKLVFHSPPYEIWVYDVKTKKHVDNGYSFVNIDEDKELELVFLYLDLDQDFISEKRNVTYDLQDGEFVLIKYE